MNLPGRIAAAIDILQEVGERHRPVSESLRDWGRTHRFAGAGDRAAIGNIVYDSLRHRALHAWRMGEDTPRAIVLATMVFDWSVDVGALAEAFSGDRHAPPPLTESEGTRLRGEGSDPPDPMRANIPEWLVPSFEANFDDDWVGEAVALAERPPLDLRANTLKRGRDKLIVSLKRYAPRPTAIARHGLRIAPTRGAERHPNLQAEEGYQRGHFEIQDEGSQICADLVFARPGEQVLDFCAGAGGKTLAMSAAMENRGQIHAFDTDRARLAPIFERLKRAGVRNVQVHPSDADLTALYEKMDRVLVDAPCSGSGTWRRRPDAKWRLTPQALERRIVEQEEALAQASLFVRPGGFLVYATCSVLPEENEAQIVSFLEDRPTFSLISAGEVWQELYGFDKPQPWSADLRSLTLTPASTGTDGFFFAVMSRDG